MSVVARLEVIPTREGSMADAVASAVEALDGFDVSYETTPTDTVVEADDPGEVFAAAEAAHRAVADDRVITSLEVDDLRTRTQRGRERVASVERHLGRPAKRERWQTARRERQQGTGQERQQGTGQERQRGGESGVERRPRRTEAGPAGTEQSTGETGLYGGPWRSGDRQTGSRMGTQTGAGTETGAGTGTAVGTGTGTRTGGRRSRYLRTERPVSR